MPETPTPWTATWRDDHTLIIVGPDTDNGQSHTVAELHPCDDGTHPDRTWADGQLIVAAVNERAELLAEIERLRGERSFWRDVGTDLYDDEPCSYDHHGYCQAHGWLSPSECPHARMRRLIAPATSTQEGPR